MPAEHDYGNVGVCVFAASLVTFGLKGKQKENHHFAESESLF